MSNFQLPDGTTVGTGLLVPPAKVSALPVYEDVGPMLTAAEIEAAAKAGTVKGSTRFDRSFVKNQQSHGSCNGFAGALALTRARLRRGLPRVDLSGAYLYSLINGNSDNGSMLEDGMAAMQAQGVATEATVGVNQIYRTTYDRAKADAEAAKYKGFECYAVRTNQGLFSALASGFDCVVAVHADNGFMSLDGRGVAGGGNGPGNHAVLADGLWWDGELIADGCNSWGLSYGREGRMGLTWSRHFSKTTPYHVFYAIRSTTDSPEDTPPEAKP